MVKIWKLRFGHKTKLLFRLWAQGLVNILKLGLTKILSLSLVKILMLSWDLDVSAWLKLWNCLIKICVITCDMNSTLGSVVPLAMFFYFFVLFRVTPLGVWGHLWETLEGHLFHFGINCKLCLHSASMFTRLEDCNKGRACVRAEISSKAKFLFSCLSILPSCWGTIVILGAWLWFLNAECTVYLMKLSFN